MNKEITERYLELAQVFWSEYGARDDEDVIKYKDGYVDIYDYNNYVLLTQMFNILNIIKEKEVNMSVIHHSSDAEHYNYIIQNNESYLFAGHEEHTIPRFITQEEYVKLKHFELLYNK